MSLVSWSVLDLQTQSKAPSEGALEAEVPRPPCPMNWPELLPRERGVALLPPEPPRHLQVQAAPTCQILGMAAALQVADLPSPPTCLDWAASSVPAAPPKHPAENLAASHCAASPTPQDPGCGEWKSHTRPHVPRSAQLIGPAERECRPLIQMGAPQVHLVHCSEHQGSAAVTIRNLGRP